MKALSADIEEIKRSTALFLEPGHVVELRAPKTPRDGVISGYFSDPAKLAQAARDVSGKAPGVYVTLNPVLADLIARADNRVKSHARSLTGDPEITRRRWLLLDFDPRRPADISSTDAEHEAALDVGRTAYVQLRTDGWPEPVRCDSGNGAHLLYRIDLPNDLASAELIKAVLQAALQRYATPAVDVDTKVYNASRISKIYGTVARKGDSTAERPHRLSRILSQPDALVQVPVAQLQALAAEVRLNPPAPRPVPDQQRRPHGVLPALDLEKWIREHGVDIERGPELHQGAQRWVLRQCPFNPAHLAPDAAIFQQPNGRLGFECFHNSCADKDWRAFREFYEPGYNRTPSRRERSDSESRHLSEDRDKADKISASAAEVEAAADAAVEANDISDAMRLIPKLAALRPVSRVVIVAKLRQHFRKSWKDREFSQALAEAIELCRKGSAPPPEDDSPDSDRPDGPDLLGYPLTDAGNGERIVAMFGTEIRYCVEMQRWLVWDGIRWVVDYFDVMRQKAKKMCRLLHEQAKRLESEKVKQHARASESYGAVTAALGFASTENGIRIFAADLDQHPFLLNCPNGVVNLRDGKLLRHNRDFLISKLCPVPYVPTAECPRFLDFLQWAMGANPDAEITERTARLVGYLQRALGYALTSDVSEKAVFIFYGKKGNNGKTTLLSLWRDLLGRDYSGQIAIETIMATAKQQDATMRADLADLRGVRLVVTSEVDKESKLNERMIKYITAGGAPIKSCRKYENPIEFWATHKLFMDCNYRPAVRDPGNAIWKRLKPVPFEMEVIEGDDMDKQLPEKLRTELTGILAWAVRGCMAWMKGGLGEPPEIKAAGKQWREHDDPLKDFLEDCCRVDLESVESQDPDTRLFVTVADLNAAYEWWVRQSREKFSLGREAMRERMEAKGFRENRGRRIGLDKKQVRTWEGLELLSEVTSTLRKSPSVTIWPEREG